MIKDSICRAPYLRNHVSHDHHVWYATVKWLYLQEFFHFFKNFDYSGCSEGQRGKKWPKMTKKTLLCLISQEPYIIWSSFMVHMCNRIISPRVFYIYSKFLFGVNNGVKGKKMAQSDKKLCLSYSISQEAYITWLWL